MYNPWRAECPSNRMAAAALEHPVAAAARGVVMQRSWKLHFCTQGAGMPESMQCDSNWCHASCSPDGLSGCKHEVFYIFGCKLIVGVA
jgi:hypothetical protein